MDIDKIIVAILSIFGVALTYWFFLMKKDEIVSVTDSINITVKGGYSPSVISVLKDKTTTLNFMRTDTSSCLEEVVLSDFKIRKFLPMNKTVSIEVTPQKEGEFPFSCGMGMFHGKIIVE